MFLVSFHVADVCPRVALPSLSSKVGMPSYSINLLVASPISSTVGC